MNNLNIKYSGCIKSGNIGDDVLPVVFVSLLKEALYKKMGAVEINDFVSTNKRTFAGVVGGGTLIHPGESSYTKMLLNMELKSSMVFGTGIHLDLCKDNRNYSLIDQDRYSELVYKENNANINANIKALKKVKFGGLRGPLSVQSVENLTGEKYHLGFNYDSGLLCSEYLPIESQIEFPNEELMYVGINSVFVAGPQRFKAYPGETKEEYNKRIRQVLCELCVKLIDNGFCVVFYSMNGTDYCSNKIIFEQLLEKNPLYKEKAFLLETQKASDVLYVCKKCCVTIGQRLHASILSCSVGTPSLVVAYSLKCADFAKSINQSEYVVPTSSRMSSEELFEKTEKLVKNRLTVSSNIQKHIEKAKERYMSSFIKFLTELLGDPDKKEIVVRASPKISGLHTNFFVDQKG